MLPSPDSTRKSLTFPAFSRRLLLLGAVIAATGAVILLPGSAGLAHAATPNVFKAHSYCQPVVGHGEGKTYKIAVERAVKDCEAKGGKTADCEKNTGPD